MTLSLERSGFTKSWNCNKRVKTARTSFISFFSRLVNVCGRVQVLRISATDLLVLLLTFGGGVTGGGGTAAVVFAAGGALLTSVELLGAAGAGAGTGAGVSGTGGFTAAAWTEAKAQATREHRLKNFIIVLLWEGRTRITDFRTNRFRFHTRSQNRPIRQLRRSITIDIYSNREQWLFILAKR